MAYSAATLGLIILSGFITFSAADKDICDVYAAVGQSLTLAHMGLANTDGLRWTHNKTIVFHRQRGKVSVGKPGDISATGSLLLKDVKFSSAGIYEAHVLHPNGALTNTSWTGRLCVMDTVSKPQLSYVCDLKSGAVNLNCLVAKPQGLLFSWTLGEQTLTSETKQTLSISLTHLKGESSFSCSVANKVSKEKSDPVRPTCKFIRPSPPPPTLFCLPSKTAVAVLGGGASLILLLLIIVFILCCCHKKNKTKMRRRDVELTMLSQNKREPDSTGPVYETMHEAEDSPAAASHKPAPESCYHNVSQPEVQTENRPAQLSPAAEDQRPSPVPKPRTKAPQTPNI